MSTRYRVTRREIWTTTKIVVYEVDTNDHDYTHVHHLELKDGTVIQEQTSEEFLEVDQVISTFAIPRPNPLLGTTIGSAIGHQINTKDHHPCTSSKKS